MFTVIFFHWKKNTIDIHIHTYVLIHMYIYAYVLHICIYIDIVKFGLCMYVNIYTHMCVAN